MHSVGVGDREPEDLRAELTRPYNHVKDVTGNVVQAGRIDRVVFQSAPSAQSAVAVVRRVRPLETSGEVFVGRNEEIQRVLETLESKNAGDSYIASYGASGVVVSAVAGMGGVGKTALARHAAVEAARRGWFRGGVFWVDLGGYSEEQVPAVAVFAPLLRLLGVSDEDIPTEPGEQGYIYDGVLGQLAENNAAVLLVLDNATTNDQVRDLIPIPGIHKVVITTRYTLNLPRAHRVDLNVLDNESAFDLFNQVLHERNPEDHRVSTQPAEIQLLVDSCGGLPLALRIAAALLADEPQLDADALAQQLRQAPGVKAFTYGEQALSAIFDRSWQRLLSHHPSWARLLQLLCLAPGPDLSTAAAAALAGQKVDEVRIGLRGLRQAHLLRSTSPERWSLHDLVRAYITGCHNPQVGTSELRRSHSRLFRYYVSTTRCADSHLRSLRAQSTDERFTDREDALAWLDSERPCLIAAVAQAIATGHYKYGTYLGNALAEYLRLRRDFTDWMSVARYAHSGATHLPLDHRAETAELLGSSLRYGRRFKQAIAAYEQAGALYRQLGDQSGEASTWNNLGIALRHVRCFEQAIAAHEKAAKLYRQLHDRSGEASNWKNLGAVLRNAQRFGMARAAYQRADTLNKRRAIDRSKSWGIVGLTFLLTKRFEEAINTHRQEIARCQQIKDQYSEGVAWNNLGLTLQRRRRHTEAIAAYKRAGEMHRLIGDKHGEGMAWNNLGVALRQMRQFEDAIAAHERAGELYRLAGDRHGEGVTHNHLGIALQQVARFEEAIRNLKQALDIFHATDDLERAHLIEGLVYDLKTSLEDADPT